MKRIGPMTLLAAALLGGTFIFSAARLLKTRATVMDPSIEVIRFAHWQLEPGVREALAEIAADYMALHPKVRVEQMYIGRIWQQWLRTQLVGGTPPDLIELAFYVNPDDMLARYFTPLTSYLEEANPYNADEPDLCDLSWRRSYMGELIPVKGVSYYSPNLLEYYGVPSAIVTVRVFYNRRLVNKVLGEKRTPQTFNEFVALCAALQHDAQANKLPITPLAGSVFNITMITDGLFNAATQRDALSLDFNRDLEMSAHEGLISYVRGRWSLTTPSVRAGLQTVESIGRHMPPGWVQLDRGDAMLQFLQERAAMLVTGTWDAAGILMQADFPIGAFTMPTFRRDDPKFGRWTLGRVSEANTFAQLPLGLTRSSRHPDRAIDFLRFLTSRKSNAKFSRISKWMPVIKGVSVPADLVAFLPVEDGYVGGINIRAYSARANATLMQHLYLLSSSNASADAFIERTHGLFDQAYREEIDRTVRINHETVRQKDSVLVGLYHLEQASGLVRAKFGRVAANQLEVEAQRLQNLRTLADYPPSK